jgi:hypothetical protein
VWLRAVLDHSVVESFLGGGERAVTRRVYPSQPQEAISAQLFSRCGEGNPTCTCSFLSTDAWTLRSSTWDMPSSEEGSSDSNSDKFGIWVYTLMVVIIAVLLVACFLGRFCYMNYLNPEDPLEGQLLDELPPP